eukprot:2657431-Pyramimonas_sp.AAC.1
MEAAFGAAGILALSGQLIRIFPAARAREPMRSAPGTESALDDYVREAARPGVAAADGQPSTRKLPPRQEWTYTECRSGAPRCDA